MWRTIATWGVTAIALAATMATSRARWHVEAPDRPSAPQQLDASAPRRHQRFAVDVAEDLVRRRESVEVGLVMTATWHPSEGATTSTLRFTLEDGLQSAGGLATAELALVPEQPVETTVRASYPLSDCERGRGCRRPFGARAHWDAPQGTVELTWTASASAMGVLARRDDGPDPHGALTIVELAP